MFRVPQDTVIRRVTVTSLLVLTTAFAACGDNDAKGDATTPTTAPTSVAQAPEATTPGTSGGPTPTLKPASTDPAPRAEYDLSISKKQAARFTEELETETTIKKLADNKLPIPKVMEQLKAMEAKTKKAGGTPVLTIPGETEAVGSYTEEHNKILFFRSDREAGVGTRKWQQLVNTHPGYSRIDRRGPRTYMLINPKGYTPAQLKQHEQFMKETEAFLASLDA